MSQAEVPTAPDAAVPEAPEVLEAPKAPEAPAAPGLVHEVVPEPSLAVQSPEAVEKLTGWAELVCVLARKTS